MTLLALTAEVHLDQVMVALDTVRSPHQVFLRRQWDQETLRGRHSCLILHALTNAYDCPTPPLIAAVILDD
jgi:hypothetical protein